MLLKEAVFDRKQQVLLLTIEIKGVVTNRYDP